MPLFEVAVIERLTAKATEEGVLESLFIPPTPVIAIDRQAAALAIAGKVGAEKDPNRYEVLVRPF